MSSEAEYLRSELRSLETKAKVLHDALSEAACMLEGLVANKHRVIPLHWQNARETTVRAFALLHGACARSNLTPHEWPGAAAQQSVQPATQGTPTRPAIPLDDAIGAVDSMRQEKWDDPMLADYVLRVAAKRLSTLKRKP